MLFAGFALLSLSLISGVSANPFDEETSATVSPAAEVAAAEDVLKWLVGRWTFVLGKRTGVRVVEMTYPNHVISWTEKFDGLGIEGQGYIGFAPDKRRFYSFATHNIPGQYGLALGTFSSNDEIVYAPIVVEPGARIETVWQRSSDNQFSYTPYEIQPDGTRKALWTAVFTRSN